MKPPIASHRPAQRPRHRLKGFTLVEVLVALLVMSLLAVMAWQGVDAMIRARDVSQQRLEATLRLNTALAQWQQDLASVQETPSVPGLRFDGASLQLTRRTPAGLQLVVWSLRGGRWLRWSAPSATSSQPLQESWMRSQQLQGTEAGQLVVLEGVSAWQVYFFRGNAWSNAQSSGDLAAPAQGASAPIGQALPNGVRLLLTFAEGSGYVGNITRDTVLGPQP
jgi:general secretion pathway protein J